MTQFTGAAGEPAVPGDPISLSQMYAAFAILDGDASATTICLPGAPGSVLARALVVDAHRLRAYGFIGDGQSHPLSSIFPTLAIAQAAYPAAQSLFDEIDGSALQSVIDAAGGRPVVLVLPPGSTGRCSRSLVTGASALNILGNWSTLIFPGGTNGISHTAAAGGCSLQIEKLALECQGIGGTAIAVTLSPVTGYLTLTDVMIQGAGNETANYWQYGVAGVNCSLTTLTRVSLTGCNGGLLSNAPGALKFTSTTGAYQFVLRDVTINCWGTALEVDTASSPGCEGVVCDNFQANTCIVGVKVSNSQYPTYVPPQYVFQNCQWNIYQQWLNIQGASEIWVTDNLCYIHKPDGSSGSYSPLDFVLFTQCENVEYRGNSVEGDGASTIANGIRFTACSVANVRSNKSHQYGAMTAGSAGVLIDAGCDNVKEDGDNFFLVAPGATPAVNNGAVGSGCVSVTQVVELGGTVDVAGNVAYQGGFVGTTAADGSLSVPIPAGLFHSVSAWLVSNGDSGTSTVSPVVRASSLLGVSNPTSFTVVFPGVASTPVRVEYLLRGA